MPNLLERTYHFLCQWILHIVPSCKWWIHLPNDYFIVDNTYGFDQISISIIVMHFAAHSIRNLLWNLWTLKNVMAFLTPRGRTAFKQLRPPPSKKNPLQIWIFLLKTYVLFNKNHFFYSQLEFCLIKKLTFFKWYLRFCSIEQKKSINNLCFTSSNHSISSKILRKWTRRSKEDLWVYSLLCIS